MIKNVVMTVEPAGNIVGSGYGRSSTLELRYENLLVEGRGYVFDGNSVVAHWRVGRNGVGRWRLETITPNLSLVITPDLRVREYRRTGRTCRVRMVRSFETVFDAIRQKPLQEAVSNCAQHGHLWSLDLKTSGKANDPYVWTWCLTCGAEQVWFLETGQSLEWPADADEIALRTAGALPTLHGPIVGGSSCSR